MATVLISAISLQLKQGSNLIGTFFLFHKWAVTQKMKWFDYFILQLLVEPFARSNANLLQIIHLTLKKPFEQICYLIADTTSYKKVLKTKVFTITRAQSFRALRSLFGGPAGLTLAIDKFR